MTLLEFQRQFSTEKACLEHLAQTRWEKGRYCPHCGSYESYAYKNGKLFKCKDCFKQFTVKVGTIFEDSKVSMDKWYLAIYLASSLKKGISSVQLATYLGVTQKTSWYMLHRIRAVFENEEQPTLHGTVEIDETYYGKNTHTPGSRGKATVFGMLQWDGKVKAKVVKSSGARILLPEIKENISKGSTIYSDEAQVYKTLKRRNYFHATVNHSKAEYARGIVTTNTIEGFWSHFKRTVVGTYHYVSQKHLNRYVHESAYRYNSRKLKDMERFDHWLTRINTRMPYKTLIE